MFTPTAQTPRLSDCVSETVEHMPFQEARTGSGQRYKLTPNPSARPPLRGISNLVMGTASSCASQSVL